MNAIRAVLFDLDNTLYENDEELEEWAKQSAQELITADQSVQLMRALPEILEHIASSKCAEGPAAENGGDISTLLCRLLPELSSPAIEFISAMYTNWLADMHLTPDAAELLTALDGASIPYGIVTNAPSFQWIKIGGLGLATRAQCVLISEEFGVEKPDPAIFAAAADAIGVPCGQILFVGDSPHRDVQGAHNAGMKAAWLRRGRTWPEEMNAHPPEYTLNSLREVFGIVK
jgi:putative hydrolase of the HAD superfamily